MVDLKKSVSYIAGGSTAGKVYGKSTADGMIAGKRKSTEVADHIVKKFV